MYQLIRKGEMHKVFCEDFLLATKLNEQYTVYGVFDGCSSAINSHFASALLAKVVRKELQSLVIEPFNSISTLFSNSIFRSMRSLQKIKNDLLLETDELLSTMILLFVDNFSKKAQILAFGDGFIAINGRSVSIDQNNSPDYLAYHLDELENINDFGKWLNEKARVFEISEIQDVSISTDGINSFQSSEIAEEDDNPIIPSDYFTNNSFLLHNKSMLARKYNILKTKYRMVNQDDIAMIRIIA
ncbi:MAG: protein phosphatase 2C domain-containing protein [Bacteroidales bacterium]|nr:protein phosphatase 2C domain-containing protein [Bacteroidales bacterium]